MAVRSQQSGKWPRAELRATQRQMAVRKRRRAHQAELRVEDKLSRVPILERLAVDAAHDRDVVRVN